MIKSTTLDQQLQTPPFMAIEDLNDILLKDALLITQAPDIDEEVCAVEVNAERIHPGEHASQGVLSDSGRDSGVSDAVWAELQMAKQAEEKYLEKCLAEEAESTHPSRDGSPVEDKAVGKGSLRAQNARTANST